MQRPVPDENLIRRAHRVLEAEETPMERFLREEHDAMMGAARIGMDATRRVWPIEKDHLHEPAQEAIGRAHGLFEQAYSLLDGIAEHFHGDLVHGALLGHDITARLEGREDKLKIGPLHDAVAEAPPIGD